MTNFHPDAQWLSEYVAGTLADSQALCVSTHLAFCTQCTKDATEITQISAALFDKHPSDSDVSPNTLPQIFSAIDSVVAPLVDKQEAKPTKGDPARSEQLPQAVQKLISQRTNDLRWRKIGSKISIAKLDTLGDEREIALHKLQPGGTVSNHDHSGREITVVLRGSFSDDDGQYHPGDFLVREPGDTHQPTASNNEECLCLAVCDAPVKFTGLLTRLLNPLVAFQHKH